MDHRGRRGTDTGERLHFTASFLWMCQGYYRHAQGYMPKWPGMETFKGPLVHSETWPEDLDYKGKKVVVIGSGATAATIIPAIADDCAHVTMLQRSPTFFITGRNVNDLAETLRQLQIDEAWIHEIVRRKILYDQAAFTRRCIEEPDAVAKELIGVIRNLLGPDYDVETHFTPTYRPWRQRIAFVPDADLFKSIANGKASVVTDEIECFNRAGILLKSGKQLDADIIVAATGFNINVLGDIDFVIDGKPLVFSDTVTYRGHDVHGTAQSRLGVRLLPRELDTALGLGRRLRVPPPETHGPDRRQEGHRRSAVRKTWTCRCCLDRSAQFQSWLHHALHAPAAQAGRQARMAAQPGLLERKGPISRHRSLRCCVRLCLNAIGHARRRPHGLRRQPVGQ